MLSKIPDIRWNGPSWIAENKKNWPDQPILSESKQSEKETKIIKNIHMITRFINNCRKIKKRGPLTTSEIQCQEKLYIEREQRKIEHSEKFEENRK